MGVRFKRPIQLNYQCERRKFDSQFSGLEPEIFGSPGFFVWQADCIVRNSNE
jgi:hypothetical protein